MAHAASGDTPLSRPRRSQQKNSRFTDYEWEMIQPKKKSRTPSQPAPTNVGKQKKGKPPKGETPASSTVKENEPEPNRRMTKRGLANSSLSKQNLGSSSTSKRGRPPGSKNKPKTEDVKPVIQDIEVNVKDSPKKKKRGRPKGSTNKKNILKVKTDRNSMPLVKREVMSYSEESDSDDDDPFGFNRVRTFSSGSHEESTWSLATDAEQMKQKVQRIEEGKIKLQKLKSLAAERFGKTDENAKEDEDSDSDDDDLLSSSDSAGESVIIGDQFMEIMDSDSSWKDSDIENTISDDSEVTSPVHMPLPSYMKSFGKKKATSKKQTPSFLAGKVKLERIKKMASAIYDTSNADRTNQSESADTPPSQPSLENDSDNNPEADGSEVVVKQEMDEENGSKSFSAIWESEEYHKGKEKLEKLHQMASNMYGVKPQKKLRSMKRSARRFRTIGKKAKKTIAKDGQTNVTSDEYGEIIKRSGPDNPVTTYKLGEKYCYTVTCSEDNPDVLTFALDPPPRPSQSKLSHLTEALINYSKTHPFQEVPFQQNNDLSGESTWNLDGAETNHDSKTISILPTNFAGTQLANQEISENSEQTQTIVVSGAGQDHILTEGDMQNAYTVEIQHPDGTTQEHISFDNGLTFVVNDMQGGTGTVPVSLAELADLATLQVASSDGQTLALPPGLTFAQQGEDGETATVALPDQIDPATLKSLVASGADASSDHPIVFIVKQEEEPVAAEEVENPEGETTYTQWSICGDADQKVIKNSVGATSLLDTAAITGNRHGTITQEYLEEEVSLDRLKQIAATTTFQEISDQMDIFSQPTEPWPFDGRSHLHLNKQLS